MKYLNKRVLEAVDFIRDYFKTQYDVQCFNTRNMVGDSMCNIYDKNGIVIDYCFDYDYIEVFGFTELEYKHFLRLIKKH